MRASRIPSARAAAVAAAAFSRLCAPGISGSAGSGSLGSNSIRSARPGMSSKPTGTTATSPSSWFSKIRSFAARYASIDPCRSRWSGSRLSSRATCGLNSWTSSSWKLDTSHTTTSPGSIRPSRSDSARPTLPATGAPSITPRSSLVVVFPFVPVTPTIGFPSSREPSSISLQTGIPRARAAATSDASPGTPGLLISVSTPSSKRSSSVPRWSSTPASASLLVSMSGDASTPITSSPRRRSARAAAWPERARPRTRKLIAESGSRGRSGSRTRRPRRT